MMERQVVVVALLAFCCPIFATAYGQETAESKPSAADIEKARAQDKFFKAIETGNPKLVFELFAPALREKVDYPVIEAWVAILKQELGAYKGLSWTDFKTSVNIVDGKKIQEASGTFLFEKDKVDGKFVYEDGKLLRFSVHPRTVGKTWSHRPSSTKLYEDKAIAFLKELCNGDVALARGLMHQELRKVIDVEKTQGIRQLVDEEYGRLKSWKIERVATDSEKIYQVLVFVELTFEKLTQVGSVGFQFAQLRGHLSSFNLAANGEFEDEQHDQAAAFFTAVGKGDFKAAMAEMHPVVLREIDPPVFKVWVNALKNAVGEYSKPGESFKYRLVYDGGDRYRAGMGPLQFENGTVEAQFKCFDGKVTAFRMNTEKLKGGWFKGPGETTFYKDKASVFLKALTSPQPAPAFEMMHDSLKKNISLEQFQKGFGQFTSKHGPITTVKFSDEKYDDSNGQTLVVSFVTAFGKGGTSTATVTFRFIGLQGHILAFDIKPPQVD